MKRRMFLIAGVSIGLGAVGPMSVLRWHVAPRRSPKMTDAHLATLGDAAQTGPKVLFVGNSMLLRNDLPSIVATLAERDGVSLSVATAAASGMRLVEALRVSAFELALRLGWDALVLQDFSTTALRSADRWGSAYAMQRMARLSEARTVVLCPTWAFPATHPVYQRGGGWLSAVPNSPSDFAGAITDHYDTVAEANGWARAPITEAFLPDATPWLSTDLHHPNEEGSRRAGRLVWGTLRSELERVSLI